MNNSIGIIIQARTGSTRLPNKIILPFYNHHGVLEILLERLKMSFPDMDIVVATTLCTKDNDVVEICENNNVDYFRGDEKDVLDRFIKAAKKYNLKKLIRICADNPFLDMDSLKILIDQFEVSEVDYLAFSTSYGLPTIKTHYGFWGEAVKLSSLEKIVYLTSENLYHEHVTNFIYNNPSLFNIKFIEIPMRIENNKQIRLTLDTFEDFQIQKEIFSCLMKRKKVFNMNDVISILDAHPNYYKLMEKQISKNTK